MDRRDLEEIERFLASVGRPTLFAYYGLEPSTTPEEAEEGVKKRRAWAQGQQSNPKYKSEALFLIKNNGLLRKVMVDQLGEYRELVRDETATRNLDVLSLFIRGTLSGGRLTPQGEAAILHQGRQLELSDAAVTRRIQELLTETNAVREGFDSDDVTAESISVDHYAVLGVGATSSLEIIEEAYRSRYRWARNLKDLKRSAEILQTLDEAWRILSDPHKRAKYDLRRVEVQEVTDEVEKRAAVLMGLLPAPDSDPLPAPHESPVHEVGFRPQATDPPRSPPDLPPIAPLPPAPAPPVPARSDPPRSASNTAPPAPARTEPPRAPAPPPAPVTGRTIGLAAGPQTVGTTGPRLAVSGPDVVAVTVSGKPVRRQVEIRNVGQGKMPGRVLSDREWLEVPPARLDPGAASQVVPVTIYPSRLPWGGSAGTVTVVTDHGERRTITFNVNRRSWARYVIAAGVALAFLFFLAVAGLFLLGRGEPPPEPGKLVLTVDPQADKVLVDGVPSGSGSRVEIADTHDGHPFKLRVEADGFAPFETALQLEPGARTERSVRLELADDMDAWAPPEGQAPRDLGRTGEAELVKARTPLAECFVGIEGITDAVAIYRAYVTADGEVRRVDVTVPNFALPPAQPCIRRVFRGLRLARFDGGHAIIEARISVPVTR